MRKNTKWYVVFFALVFLFSTMSFAVTMGKKKVKCPVCETVNTFTTVYSWGSYVYEDFPLQLVNWPATLSFPHYICKNCKYAALSDDFDELPKEEIEKVRKVLKQVAFDETFEDYENVPISKRLEIAEKVYSVLDRDDYFRSWFYRVMGYHYELEKQEKKAEEARKKALSITTGMLEKKQNEGERKWLLLTSGAMKFFLNDNGGALHDFKNALKLRIMDKEQDKYCSAFITEYIKTVLEAEKERYTFSWYYEMGNVYSIKIFRLRPVGLIYSLLAGFLVLLVPLLMVGGIRQLSGIAGKSMFSEHITLFLLVIFMFSGIYFFLKVFVLSFSIEPAFLIALTWWMASAIFRRIVRRKKSGNKGLTAYLKDFTGTGAWKITRVLMFCLPFIMTLALALNDSPDAALQAFKLMGKRFEKFFDVGWEIIITSIGVWFIGFVGIFILYQIVKVLFGRKKNSVFPDYIFNALTLGLIFWGSTLFLGTYGIQFPVQTILLIGCVWLLCTIVFEFAIVRRSKRSGNRMIELKNLFKTRLWFMVRIIIFAAPFIAGLYLGRISF